MRSETEPEATLLETTRSGRPSSFISPRAIELGTIASNDRKGAPNCGLMAAKSEAADALVKGPTQAAPTMVQHAVIVMSRTPRDREWVERVRDITITACCTMVGAAWVGPFTSASAASLF